MVPAEQVREQLERILAGREFSGADRLTRFLRFTVERTLAGQGGDIKEYLLGTEVFDRGSAFDPRLNPIVRVEAHRLRAKLQEYYAGSGQADPVRIVYRKGSYAPAFELAQAAAPPAQRSIRVRPWMLATALAGVVAVTWILSSGANEDVLTLAVFTTAESPPRDPSRMDWARCFPRSWRATLASASKHGPSSRSFGLLKARSARKRCTTLEAVLFVAVQAEIARVVADEVGRALPRFLN